MKNKKGFETRVKHVAGYSNRATIISSDQAGGRKGGIVRKDFSAMHRVGSWSLDDLDSASMKHPSRSPGLEIAMALFGMVWLLRVRSEMRRCSKCRHEEILAAQQQQQQQQQQQLHYQQQSSSQVQTVASSGGFATASSAAGVAGSSSTVATSVTPVLPIQNVPVLPDETGEMIVLYESKM